MNLKRRRWVLAVCLIALLIIVLFRREPWEANERRLKQEIQSIGAAAEVIDLWEVTPFSWDRVYSFTPYTPREQIYETVGYKWGRIQETFSEGMNQLVFLQDGKVVCYVYGYPENNGYGISFQGETVSEFAQVLTSGDAAGFHVTRTGNAIYLEMN